MTVRSYAAEADLRTDLLLSCLVPVWCEVIDEFRSGRGIIVFSVAPVSQVSCWCAKTFFVDFNYYLNLKDTYKFN